MDNRIILPKDHFYLKVGQEMQQLINPLENFGIKTLTYMRNYDDGHQVYLTNNTYWVEEYYHNNLCGNFISGHPKKYTQKYLIIPNESPLIVHKIGREKFDEGNSFCLINRYPNYTEFFFFAGNVTNTTITNFFINNINLFESFTLHFKSYGELLLKQAEKNRIHLPNPVYAQTLPKLAQITYDDQSIKTVLKDMKIKYYRSKDKKTRLSSREIDCIVTYLQDKTAKECGKILDISYRTVEQYFNNINKKLNFNDKKDSIKFILEDGFPRNVLTFSTYQITSTDPSIEKNSITDPILKR